MEATNSFVTSVSVGQRGENYFYKRHLLVISAIIQNRIFFQLSVAASQRLHTYLRINQRFIKIEYNTAVETITLN